MVGHDHQAGADLLEALDVGLIVVGADGQVQAWNAWMISASGIARQDALGRPITAVLPEVARGRLQQAIADALHADVTSLITHALHPNLLPLRTPAGQPMLHSVSVRAVGAPGAPRCMIQVFDVTAASQRERILRERQNARYNAVVNSAPDAIVTIDSAGIIQLANPSALESFGYGSAEILGQPVSILFGQQGWWAETWGRLMRGESQEWPLEVVATRKDGSPSHIEMSASRWVSDGRVFVTAILRDVNERRYAEQLLLRLNETLEARVGIALAERKLFADMVNATAALVQAVDLDYRVLAVNRAQADWSERMFGRRLAVGDDFRALLASDYEGAQRFALLWDRALSGESFTSIQQVGPEHARSWYEFKFDRLLDAEGRQVAAFQFAYDVSDRVEGEVQLAQAQDALRQSQKMEAIGQLTGGIAHDFNNLLTGIIGAMDVLKRRIAARRYEDTSRFMDAASASANRAAALTHRLLAFARRQPLDPKPVDVNNLVRGTEELLARTLGEQVVLATDLAPDLWMVFSDSGQLESAILNLAINARDAMPEGGRLTISTENAVVGEATTYSSNNLLPGHYVVVAIADTGTGMSPEVAEKAFEPFFTTKPIGQGTGLGLSMVYGFAKQTQGGVRIDSTEGVGTRVSIFLPRFAGIVPEEPQMDVRTAADGKGMNVLLIEDDAAVRLLIGHVLRELGYACIEATDGQSALPILASNARIDLMITDVGLPGMNGHQVGKIARQHRPGLKILFVTGYAEHAVGNDQFLDAGTSMMTKPFSLDTLALKIRDMIQPAPVP